MAAYLIFTILFVYATIGILLAEAINRQQLRYLTKPLLMPLLLVFYILFSDKIQLSVVAALLFSFVGDIMLMWPKNKTCFSLGLAAFLCAHLAYIGFLLQISLPYSGVSVTSMIIALLYLIIGFLIFSLLAQKLGKLKMPVLVYIITLLTMSFLCFMLLGKIQTSVFVAVFVGSVLFIASDTILAFHNFRKPIKLAGVWFMITYIAAQVLLVSAFTTLKPE